jgi:CRISPR-associated protein Cmr5
VPGADRLQGGNDVSEASIEERFRTREQIYAAQVYECIKPLIPREGAPKNEAEERYRKAYGSLAHKLPVLIRSGGLAQSLAFVQARNRDDTPQRKLLADLETVLQNTGVLAARKHLVDHTRTASFEEYMRLTEGALEALLWFKRFVQSELKVEATDESQEAQDGATT